MPFTRVAGTDVERIGTYVLAAEELKVQPGDVITYYARARDVARKRLDEYEPPPIDDAVREELAEYVTRRRRELGD